MPKKIGVVGAGVIADCVHIPGILASPDVTLAALCDTDPNRLEMMRKKYNLPEKACFGDISQLLQQANVDALDICTPNDAHAALAEAAVQAGLPYALEKPVTLTAPQAQALAEKTAEKNLASMVCFSYRFKAAARYARHLVQSGQLGQIYHVYMQYFQAWSLPVCEIPLVWRFQKERTGSGALGDLGSHGLDLVRFVTGREYTRVVSHNGTFVQQRPLPEGGGTGKVDVDDFSHYMAEMSGGLPAAFQITRFAYGRGNYQRMEIYGSEGALVYHLDVEPNVDSLHGCFGEAMRRGNNFAQLTIPEEYKADQMQSFANILLGKGDGLAATIQDGLANQKAVDAVLRSHISGKWEDIV